MGSKFYRDYGKRRYARIYFISTEGAVTEPQYFNRFKSDSIRIECIRAIGNSSPQGVLQRMVKRLDCMSLRAGDEAWLVVDKDRWSDEQLQPLYEWSNEKGKKIVNRGLAVSNPKFELWLLLHFSDAHAVDSSASCSNELNKYLKGYKKEIPAKVFDNGRVNGAIARAKAMDTPPCTDWPRKTGTTIYRLVESMAELRSEMIGD